MVLGALTGDNSHEPGPVQGHAQVPCRFRPGGREGTLTIRTLTCTFCLDTSLWNS